MAPILNQLDRFGYKRRSVSKRHGGGPVPAQATGTAKFGASARPGRGASARTTCWRTLSRGLLAATWASAVRLHEGGLGRAARTTRGLGPAWAAGVRADRRALKHDDAC
jgi:hypothetical protein